MSDAIPFVSLPVGTETGTGDCVMGDDIPFDSLAVGTAAGTGTEEPTPNRGCQEFCVFRLTNRI